MGVGDVDDPRYPFLAPEITLLREALARDAPVLAICLGAQLLAAAAGARVYPNTRRGPHGAGAGARGRLGSGRFRSARDREPVLAGLRAREMVLHWHGDTFDFPRGATPLASTPLCRIRPSASGTRQFGFQFHCELEAASIAVWVREDAEFVREANGEDGGARILADTVRFYAEARRVWDRLLRNMIDLLRA